MTSGKTTRQTQSDCKGGGRVLKPQTEIVPKQLKFSTFGSRVVLPIPHLQLEKPALPTETDPQAEHYFDKHNKAVSTLCKTSASPLPVKGSR